MPATSFPREDIKILLLEGLADSAVRTLKNAGYTQIDYRDGSLTGDDLKQAIADAHIIGIRSRTQLTQDVFDHARRLMAVGCFCIGRLHRCNSSLR